MIRAILAMLVLGLGASFAVAQSSIIRPEIRPSDLLTPDLDLDGPDDREMVETVEEPQAAVADGAILRGLDKVSGAVVDMQMANGDVQLLGRLEVVLGECRYPAGNPAGDAFAYVVIREGDEPRPSFEGWMIASSPALNALDHSRYDIWVLRCISI